MPLMGLPSSSAGSSWHRGHTLVQLYVVADDAGLADYHTRTMVDGKITAYFRSRMDIDSCFTMRHLGDDAGNEGDTQLEQFRQCGSC